MDLYTLDDFLRRSDVIDEYDSLIWTERYNVCGDFELVIKSDRGSRAALVPGTLLAINKSKYVMVVETVESSVHTDGSTALKVTGRSLESILEHRAGTPGMVSLTDTPEWNVTGLPAAVARYLFQTICVDKVNSVEDGIPYYTAGTISTPGTIAEPATSVAFSFDLESLYDLIQKICAMYSLGFRLIRDGDKSKLYFEVYTGNDHTTLQTVFPAVIFSPDLDNLSGTSELTSVAQLKNVAYVLAPNGSAYVYPDGVDSTTVTGFNRKVLFVKADNIDLPAGAALQTALQQRGKEELAKNRVVLGFDGEIPQSGSYIYGTHYNLGDLVEKRNSDGLAVNMRVTEQIFVSDQSGERAYPSLASDLLITPGSWYAWQSSQVWDDAVGYWADY